MDSLQRHEEVKDFLQTFELSRNEDYLIDPTVRSIRMGLGWDRGTNEDADVDASVALFDDRLRLVDTVWYKKLKSTCGSVTHSGDNLTGVGEGDDEVISVELADLPLRVHHLLFTVCVFSYDVSFRQIRSAYIRMMHGKERYSNRELCHFSLTDMSGHAMVVGALTRKGPYWNFRALEIPATGRTILELLQNPRNLECLNSIPSYNPEMRQVTIDVLRGTDLAAKDVTGIFRRTYSSDRYFVITFKNKRYTSEHRPKTLEPERKSPPFQLGWMNEVETKALKVQIFDYDAIGADDFMGMIRIPGHALYNLGLGDHTYWFELGSSKKKVCGQEAISGKVLVHFRIDGQHVNSAPSHHPNVQPDSNSNRTGIRGARRTVSERIAQVPQNSNAPADIIMENGIASLDCAHLAQELLRAFVAVLVENSVLLSIDWKKVAAGIVQVEAIHPSVLSPGNVGSQAVPETEADRTTSPVSSHQENRQVAADVNTAQQAEEEKSQITSDDEVSSSSSEGVWIPDAPYGERNRLVVAVRDLKRSQDFADDYKIGMANFAGRPHLRLAEQKFGNKASVVLKFYWKEETLENAIEMHSKVSSSEYVCRIVQTLKTSKTGHPPCIAFEKGTCTLRNWLLFDRPIFDRRWCLHQILTGLMEMHTEGVVHCDVNPLNVVFFPESVAWKLIDLDGSQKAGERRAVCLTIPYAAPEVLQAWQEEGELPIAQPSSDIWSCGVLAYEVLTGEQMFGDDLTHIDVCELISCGRVDEKLNLINNASHREAISRFLKLDPVERWSAVDALQHVAFQSDPQTTWSEA